MRTVSRNLQSVGYPTIPEAVVKRRLTVPKNDEQYTPHAPMHSRRLDDRIRGLCARLVSSTEHHDVDHILPELRDAIHESIKRLRIRAAAALGGRGKLPEDRRKAS